MAMSESSIIFPGLNIVFKNVKSGFEVFGFHIAFYGIVIAFGMLCASLFISWNAKHYGEDSDRYYNLTILSIIAGIMGARLYYVVFSWDLYKDNIFSILNLRAGGLAIYGGIIGGSVLVYIYTRKNHLSMTKACDIMFPGVAIGQIFGRFGNFFNREAFGEYSDNFLRMGLPITSVRSSLDITEEMVKNSQEISGIEFIFVHPTFLYESLWNIGVLALLILIGKKAVGDGRVLAAYLFCYGIGRFLIERLRTDQLLIMNTNIPISMVVSLICIIIALYIFLKIYIDKRKRKVYTE